MQGVRLLARPQPADFLPLVHRSRHGALHFPIPCLQGAEVVGDTALATCTYAQCSECTEAEWCICVLACVSMQQGYVCAHVRFKCVVMALACARVYALCSGASTGQVLLAPMFDSDLAQPYCVPSRWYGRAQCLCMLKQPQNQPVWFQHTSCCSSSPKALPMTERPACMPLPRP